MKFFISKGVNKQGRELFFGDLPDEMFTIIEEDWTIANIITHCGGEPKEADNRPIPRGLSQFETSDFEKSIFILNL